MTNTEDNPYLTPTEIIDSDHPTVVAYAAEITNGDLSDPVTVAITLYNRVRDDILYNPYIAYHREESYQASNVLMQGKGYCVSKASLLCALGRACGIPSRVGFATVRNHIATKQLIDTMGSNEFVYHGYTQFLLNGRWVIATPAFDTETCKRHRVDPLVFNGIDDSKYQQFNKDKADFMEYIDHHGSYADIPVDTIMAAFRDKYGNELVQKWIDAFEAMRGIAKRRFSEESVVN
ncbi:transglutaminase family protein [Maricurvus nonylphenolicus]|uniref:transglutaminase-like domain-containing protein n=1 Tax=Maricurvus nonylphenolicus TaxID=1008307 RepID=UPI0036F1976B